MLSWESLEEEAVKGSSVVAEMCKFGHYLNSLEPSVRHYVDNALSNKKISNRALWRALQARGMECGVSVLDRHRNGSCACSRDIK